MKVRSLDEAASKLAQRYAAKIEDAAGRVYEVANVTPLQAAPRMSHRMGNTLLLKREDMQPVHSFKLRGAYNKIASLPPEARARGVICASAGNHAQGVALAGKRMGIPAWIVMPKTTPGIKVESVRSLGGKAILHADTYDEAQAHAESLAIERGMTLIHPYDDPDVIAGQGTVAKEIFEQLPAHALRKLDAIFVCTGGGGLLAGIAAWVKHVSPRTRVISVEPEDSDCMAAAFEAGRRVNLSQVGLFADGVAVRKAGKEPFRVAKQLVDECMRVSVDEICAAIRDLFYEHRAVPEPAGALAVAGAKRWVVDNGVSGQNLCAIVSGANVNFDRLRHIAERAELGDEAEALLAVTIPEKPGSFRRFLNQLGRRVVTEFNYRYSSESSAHVFVGVRLTEGDAERTQVLASLREKNYAVVDMSRNEMAKMHVRFMVGGRAQGLAGEHVFRFEFPERPGACLKFLNAIGSQWNISMFHYRNHGAAYGRVLCGLQVPHGELNKCRQSLKELGYPHWEETDNPAYELFLGTTATGE